MPKASKWPKLSGAWDYPADERPYFRYIWDALTAGGSMAQQKRQPIVLTLDSQRGYGLYTLPEAQKARFRGFEMIYPEQFREHWDYLPRRHAYAVIRYGSLYGNDATLILYRRETKIATPTQRAITAAEQQWAWEHIAIDAKGYVRRTQQERQSQRGILLDETKTAKRVALRFPKSPLEERLLEEWKEHPDRLDLRGIDTLDNRRRSLRESRKMVRAEEAQRFVGAPPSGKGLVR